MKKPFSILTGVIFMALSLSTSTGCTENPVEDVPEVPTLSINHEGDFTVDAEGGNFDMSYTLVSDWADGELTTACSAAWVTDVEVGADGTVSFTVSPNEDEAERTAELSVTYTYNGEESVSDEINIVQSGFVAHYDYDFSAQYFTGSYYGTIFSAETGTSNYFIVLSDIPSDEYGSMQTGASYYQFDTFGPAPADPANPAPPAGTYTLGAEGTTENMTFIGGVASSANLILEDGTEYSSTFTSGTLEVSVEGGNYVIEANLVDANGKTHHVEYTGAAVCEDYSGANPSYSILDHDLTVNATYGVASYLAEAGDLMEVLVQLTDMEVDADGYVTPPGTILFLDIIMPYDASGNILPGTYPVSDIPTEFVLVSGAVEDFYGTPWPSGTYAQNIGVQGDECYGAVTSGTLTVSGSSGNCTLEFDLTSAEGHSISGSYTGPLEVAGIPGPISTLTGDYTLDLSAGSGTAMYYGDYYSSGGSNWVAQILPSDGITGDGLQIEIVSGTRDFESGIASGTYTVSATGLLMPGEYLAGSMNSITGSLSGTMYVGGFSEGGYVSELAPAVDGDLVIANNGNGTYDISFSFLDDLGNTWDGEWSGSMNMIDGTAAQYSAMSAADSGKVRNALKTAGKFLSSDAEQSTGFTKENVLKVSMKAVKNARIHNVR